MKIAIIGTGYVGLVTGTCLAETGNDVLCIDRCSQSTTNAIRCGAPIYEPHLDALFQRNINAKRLKFSTSFDEGLSQAEIIFLGTPVNFP